MLQVDQGAAIAMPNTSAAPKSADFGDWILSSPCQVVCASSDPMLEEAALPPLPVRGLASWKELGGHAISSRPDSVDVPGVHMQPTLNSTDVLDPIACCWVDAECAPPVTISSSPLPSTVEIDGSDGALVLPGCGLDAI
jgi:hypothetical protein